MGGLCAVAQMGVYYMASAEEVFDYIDEAGELKTVESRLELPTKYTYTDETGTKFPYES